MPTVPETLLKRRKNVDAVRKARAFAKRATVKVREVFTDYSALVPWTRL